MFKFIYEEDDVELDRRKVEYEVDVECWPDLIQHFNHFLAGCGYIAHDNKQDYPFCEPKDNHVCKYDSYLD
jgi:hypothetical protein